MQVIYVLRTPHHALYYLYKEMLRPSMPYWRFSFDLIVIDKPFSARHFSQVCRVSVLELLPARGERECNIHGLIMNL